MNSTNLPRSPLAVRPDGCGARLPEGTMASPALGRACLTALIAFGCAALGGCSDDPTESAGRASRTETNSAADTGPVGPTPPEQGQASKAPGSHAHEEGTRTITSEDGVPEIILPANPTRRIARPTRGCVRTGRTDDPILLPPAPGLRASRHGSVVVVRFKVLEASARCRPYRLRITLYTSQGRGGSMTTLYPVRERQGTKRLQQPPSFNAPPEVVRGSTVTRRGLRSRRSTPRRK
jgi:hypothetical protein